MKIFKPIVYWVMGELPSVFVALGIFAGMTVVSVYINITWRTITITEIWIVLGALGALVVLKLIVGKHDEFREALKLWLE